MGFFPKLYFEIILDGRVDKIVQKDYVCLSHSDEIKLTVLLY